MAYCGPVLIPYLFGEAGNIKKNIYNVLLFLFGRFVGYVIIGILAGILGKSILQSSNYKTQILAIIYILLATLLIIYGFHRFKEICLGKIQKIVRNTFNKRWPVLVPLLGGLITGLNICPPFLLAITKAADIGKILDSAMFFVFFFLGTSVYFIPFSFIGFFRRQQLLRIIGKFAAILAGLFYLFNGILLLIH